MTQENRRVSNGDKIIDIKVTHNGLSPVEIIKLKILIDLHLHQSIENFKTDAQKMINAESEKLTESTRKELGLIYEKEGLN